VAYPARSLRVSREREHGSGPALPLVGAGAFRGSAQVVERNGLVALALQAAVTWARLASDTVAGSRARAVASATTWRQRWAATLRRTTTTASGSEAGVVRGVALGLLLVALFAFRLYYGLSQEMLSGDALQIYLIGLKFVTTRQWPYFGPDEVHSHHQIAGPLQGLLVGVPILVSHSPEAPAVLVNVLSFAGLLLLGRWLTRRFALVPAWMTFAWLLTLPWTVNFSTHVYNPSYLLLPSCVFFVAFFELMPSLHAGMLAPGAAFFCLGIAIAASSQLHLSFPLFLPFVLVALVAQARAGQLTAGRVGWLVVGGALPLLLLVPTAARYGVASLTEALGANSHADVRNLPRIATILPRFLAFASYQLVRFVGGSPEIRRAVFAQAFWLMPLVWFLTAVALAQSVVMLVALVRPTLLRIADPGRAVRWLVAGSVLLVSAAFLFSARPPLSRNYYILCPVAFLIGYLTFGALVQGPRARRVATAVLVLGVVCQLGMAAQRFAAHPWAERRALVARAIDQGDYRIVGERRVGARY
jgi:hypothetical protein